MFFFALVIVFSLAARGDVEASPDIIGRLVGSLDIPGRVTGGLAVSDNLALVATSSGALAIDVSEPENPSITGSAGASGGACNVEVKDTNLAHAFSEWSFHTIDISDPEAIHSPGSVRVGGFVAGGYPAPFPYFGLSGDYAFVLVDQLYYWQLSRLSVIDNTDPTNPNIISSRELQDVYGGGEVEVANSVAFVVSDGIHVFNIADPTNPVRFTSIGAMGEALGIEIHNNLAHIISKVDDIISLVTYDVSEPGIPVLLGTKEVGTVQEFVSVSCRYGYMPLSKEFTIDGNKSIIGRHLIDVSDGSNPLILGELPIPSLIAAKLKDNLAFVTTTVDGVDKFLIFDIEAAIEATVNFDPDTLNLKSKGKWVTAYIELPEVYDVDDIGARTILLNGTVPAELKPTTIGDYDSDGVPDLMVKFDRSAVQTILQAGNAVEVTVSGELEDGTPFEGTDTIRIIG